MSNTVPGHHEAVVTGIYIARGDETLGPYNSLEAAALVAGGYLRTDDYAARNGDTAWVTLADFLPLAAQTRAFEPSPTPKPAAPANGTPPHRWRRLAVAFGVLLGVPLLLMGGLHWLGWHPATGPVGVAHSSPASTVAPASPAVAPSVSRVPLPAPVADGPVNGSFALILPDGSRTSLVGVRVSAYPLATLEPVLAPRIAEAQAARARLDPQVEAAAKERDTRAAEAQAALEELRKADPDDPLIRSLRFANNGAKAAAKTAENDYRYLLDERTAAAGGEVFFHDLPEPAMTAETDAQGRFTLPLPPGEEPYALAACTRQTAEDGTVHPRYWLVKLSPAQRVGHEGVRLDDGNVSSSSAADSLIRTAE